MADQKVTKMVMKVNLQRYKCYWEDQVFNEKQNTVTITVVCCSLEKIMEKIACKAGDTVDSIEILPKKPKEPEKKKEPESPKPAEKSVESEKESEKLKPMEPEKPKPAEPEKPKETPKPEKPKVVFVEPPKEAAKPPAPAPAPAPKAPAPAPACLPLCWIPSYRGSRC